MRQSNLFAALLGRWAARHLPEQRKTAFTAFSGLVGPQGALTTVLLARHETAVQENEQVRAELNQLDGKLRPEALKTAFLQWLGSRPGQAAFETALRAGIGRDSLAEGVDSFIGQYLRKGEGEAT